MASKKHGTGASAGLAPPKRLREGEEGGIKNGFQTPFREQGAKLEGSEMIGTK